MSSVTPNLFAKSKQKTSLIALALLALGLYYELQHNFVSISLLQQSAAPTRPCVPVPGLDDVLVVIKTGATEAHEKLPVHFETTLRCVPNYVIFSDLEEEIAGHRVFDVLADIDDETKKSNGDFELYNRLGEGGRDSLDVAELKRWKSIPSTASGNQGNPAWKLDKWKFLPLIDRALRHDDRAKWYVFMEVDTHLAWPALMRWLSNFDSRRPYYLGNQVQIGEVVFGHGGSGFIISKPAMQMASAHRAANLAYYDQYTAGHWAGDCVLGKLLLDAGVELTWSWPHLQGNFGALDYNGTAYDKKIWCYGAVSHHHIPPEEIQGLWEFEQDWYSQKSTIPSHKDIFKGLIAPRLLEDQINWDNLSEELVLERPIDTFEECRKACEERTDCMQFSYSDGGCFVSASIMLGNRCQGSSCAEYKSGWLNGRIAAFVQESEQCDETKWVLS